MRDVGSQLGEYFEAATERTDVADVFARTAVGGQTVAKQLVGERTVAAGHRRRWRPGWAMAVGFACALVLTGAGLLAGRLLLHEPTDHVTRPAAPATEPSSDPASWLVGVTAVAVIAILAALVVRRLRVRTKEVDMDTQRAGLRREPTEVDMQSLEHKSREVADTRVDGLQRRSRWLVTALALTLVAGSVAIGWLIIENRSLSSDLDAAVYPSESDLTARQQYMVDVIERYWSAWEANDFDTIMSLYSPTAVHISSGVESSNEDGRLRPNLEQWREVGIADVNVKRIWVVGSEVFVLSENPSIDLFFSRYVFGPGDEPLLELTDS